MITYGTIGVIMLSFLPRFLFDRLTQITPEFLQTHGIRLLMMDFDNTMLP